MPFCDIVLAAMVAYLGVPLAFTLNVRVAGIPVANGFYLSAAILVFVYYVRHPPRDHGLLMLYACAGFYLAIVAVYSSGGTTFSWWSAFQDISVYSGLPIGIAWAKLKGREGVQKSFQLWYVICCITFSLTLLGLWMGIIKSFSGQLRLVDGALFSSVVLVTMVLPCLWSARGPNMRLQRGIALAGVSLCVIFALISATRSVAIALFTSIASLAIVEIKKHRSVLPWFAVTLCGLAMFLAYSPDLSDTAQSTLLGQRLIKTDIQKENRFGELLMMTGQMSDSQWVRGAGFGTQFASPIPDPGSGGMAITPHIGLSALLFKAGGPLFMILMLGPCLVSVYRLIIRRGSWRDPFFAGATVYFVSSVISGGWAFLPLFLVGALWEVSWRGAPLPQYQTRRFFLAVPVDRFGLSKVTRL